MSFSKSDTLRVAAHPCGTYIRNCALKHKIVLQPVSEIRQPHLMLVLNGLSGHQLCILKSYLELTVPGTARSCGLFPHEFEF